MGDRPSAFRWLLCHFVPFLGFCTFLRPLLAFMPFLHLFVYFMCPYAFSCMPPPWGHFRSYPQYIPPAPLSRASCPPPFTLFSAHPLPLSPHTTLFLAHFCRSPLSGPKGPPFRPFRQAFYGFTTCLLPDVKAIRAIADGVQGHKARANKGKWYSSLLKALKGV